MELKLNFILLFFLFNASSYSWAATATPQLYQLKDLEVLETEKSYREFFGHAKDVRPSQRNEVWQQMTVSMAMGLLNELKMTAGNIPSSDLKMVLKISKWATLENDEFFVKNRDLTLIPYFRYCFTHRDFNQCYSELADFYKKNKTHEEFGFALLKSLAQIKGKEQPTMDYLLNVKPGIWPFLTGLLKSPLSEFYCSQSPLKEAVEQKIIKETYLNSNYNILDHFHPDCWKVIKKDFISILFNHTDPYTRKKVYSVVKKYVRLGQTDKQTYAMLQLLSGIKLDAQETLEFWDELKKLAKNYKQREKIQKKLSTMIPLPGAVFAGVTKQQKLIVKAISTYFPEYIDSYATTCLDHFTGVKQTPGGNPARHCHELFRLSKNLDILPQGKKDQYTKLTTF